MALALRFGDPGLTRSDHWLNLFVVVPGSPSGRTCKWLTDLPPANWDSCCCCCCSVLSFRCVSLALKSPYGNMYCIVLYCIVLSLTFRCSSFLGRISGRSTWGPTQSIT